MSIENPEQNEVEDSSDKAATSKKPYVSPTFSHIESISNLVAGLEGNGMDGGLTMGDTAS